MKILSEDCHIFQYTVNGVASYSMDSGQVYVSGWNEHMKQRITVYHNYGGKVSVIILTKNCILVHIHVYAV